VTTDSSAPLTSYVADFIANASFDDLTNTAIERSLCSILDGIGLALAGSVSETGGIVNAYLDQLGTLRSDGSVIIGAARRSAPRWAAFANGVAIHSDDFDDTQLAVASDRVYGLLTHPTAPVLPAALALAESTGASGRDLVLAYTVGVEVETKVAEAINPRHYQDGFHATGTCGAIGAAAAAGRLMGLQSADLRTALGIAASQAAGLRENFGTMTKPFHAGRASESGVVAAELTKLGWTAAPNILEAPRGFFHAAGGGYDKQGIDGMLGNPWTFDHPGVSIKPHPSGSLTHPGMTAMLELIEREGICAEQVTKVIVGTNQNMPNALIHHRPTNALQAKFSMEFCMAILLIDGRAGLPEFLDETVNRPDVQKMIEKVDFRVDPKAEAAGYDKMTTIISVELDNGRTLSTEADFGKGSPANPMNYAEVADKFRACAEFAGWETKKANHIVDDVRGLIDGVQIADLSTKLQR
jgi:2-methylcitrate dehydratase PrpD